MNSPPPKPEVILTNFFAEPTVLLVPITSRVNVCLQVTVCEISGRPIDSVYVKSRWSMSNFLNFVFNVQ